MASVFKLLREGRSLWSVMLTAVLIGLVFEALISNRLTPKTDEGELKSVAPRHAAVSEERPRRGVGCG